MLERHSFQEVMRQWVRARKATASPFDERDVLSVYPLEEYNDTLIANIEKNVMQWAAEHPEPVYPTWLEWLKSMGVIPYLMGLVIVRDVDGTFDDGHVNITENALKEIPADIAQKLGLQPKEG